MQSDFYRWYTNSSGRLFRVSQFKFGESEVLVKIHDFTNPREPCTVPGLKKFLWRDVDSPECVEAIQLLTQDGCQLSSLADMSVRCFRAFPENDKVHDVPWVFLILDDEVRYHPNLRDADYSIIPVSEVRSGTRLSTRAIFLFEIIYGDISVSRDTYEFLGPWCEAAGYHVTKIREMEAKFPNGTLGPPGSGNYLSRYLPDARIVSLESCVRLAYVYFGRLSLALTWVYEYYGFQSDPQVLEKLQEIANKIASDEFESTKELIKERMKE